jgi:hypothetical protein
VDTDRPRGNVAADDLTDVASHQEAGPAV